MTRVLRSRPATNVSRRITGCVLLGGSLLGATTATAGRLAQIDFLPSESGVRSESSTVPSKQGAKETKPSNNAAEPLVRLNALAPELQHSNEQIQSSWPPEQLSLLVEPWPEKMIVKGDAAEKASTAHIQILSVDDFEDPWMSQKRVVSTSASIPTDLWLE